MKKIIIISSLITLGMSFSFGLSFINKDVKEVKATIDINDYSACETAHANNNANGLLKALRNITSEGDAGSYNQLWSTYNTAYVREDGKIFDYYSSITNYVPGGNAQGANYKKEGDAYNREHSIPKSWWGGAESNQGADPFIVVPTDGYVNNGRSNYPFGMVKSATDTYSNSKRGSADTSYGYSGTVFEPHDSVKGDFARINFYAIAKYEDSYSWTKGEGSICFTGNSSTNFGLTNYSIKLFSYWSELDPVSDWERSVNDKLAVIQGNRNPFIDHPEYANTLWGNNSNYTEYTHSGSYTSATLTSISLDTTNVTKTFYEGGTFSYSGLVVTAHYDNGNTRIVNPSNVGSPNMNGLGTKTVTVTYTEKGVSKTATYQINIVTKTITSISASVNKTFYVGETISTSDITVKDNFNDSVTGFIFSNDNYQFTYEDASSGGNLTTKTFNNAISYQGLYCDLNVQAQRKAYEEPIGSIIDVITADDLPATSTSYTPFSGLKINSEALYAGNTAKNSSGNIQLNNKNSNIGIVSTASGGVITSVKINVGSGGNTVQVYGSNNAYSSANDLYVDSKKGTLVGSTSSTNTITFNDEYHYVGIRSSSGALYLSSIEITYGAEGNENPYNVANYIMYEDNNNQCVNKFSVAQGYFNDLSKEDKNIFMTSDDYVLSSAKERLLAWASYYHKDIDLIDDEYQIITASKNMININHGSNLLVIIAISVSIFSILSIGTYILIKKRK